MKKELTQYQKAVERYLDNSTTEDLKQSLRLLLSCTTTTALCSNMLYLAEQIKEWDKKNGVN